MGHWHLQLDTQASSACPASRTCLGHNADGEPSATLASLAVPAQAGAGAFHLGPAQWRLRE